MRKDLQNHKIDLQNNNCKSILGILYRLNPYSLTSQSFGVMPVMALKARKKDDSEENPEAVQTSESFMVLFCLSSCWAYAMR